MVEVEPTEPATKFKSSSIRHGREAGVATTTADTITAVATTTTAVVDAVVVDFKEIATATGTDKVAGYQHLPSYLANRESCTRPACERPGCRPWGYFYDSRFAR